MFALSTICLQILQESFSQTQPKWNYVQVLAKQMLLCSQTPAITGRKTTEEVMVIMIVMIPFIVVTFLLNFIAKSAKKSSF